MTTLPDPVVAAADLALTDRARHTGELLAVLIAHGMLERVARPAKLPELLFPDIDPEHVRRVWDAAVPVGYHAGKLAARPSWTPEALGRLRTALAEVGYTGMGRLAEDTPDLWAYGWDTEPADARDADDFGPHPGDFDNDRTRP
jgi:hypothetical protein